MSFKFRFIGRLHFKIPVLPGKILAFNTFFLFAMFKCFFFNSYFRGLIKKKEVDDYKVELAQDLKRETVLVREDNGHQEHFSEIWRKQKVIKY